MERRKSQPEEIIVIQPALQIAIIIFTVALIGNLNAIVDSVLHPEIPYFDREHLIVGGVAGAVSAVLFGVLILYTRHLEQALGRIRMLESFLPICSNCKRIRISDTNFIKKESWQSIEAYITEHTTTEFSHSMCPECVKKLYSGLEKDTIVMTAPPSDRGIRSGEDSTVPPARR